MIIAAEAPWWGVVAISSAASLATLALSLLVNARTNRARDERDDRLRVAEQERLRRERWLDQIRQYGAEMVALLDDFVNTAWVADRDQFDWDPEPKQDRIWAAHSLLQLVSPKIVVDASRAALAEVSEVAARVHGYGNQRDDDPREALHDRRDELVRVLRETLGVKDD